MRTIEGLVFVNNSRETFTPTASGAIATCIVEVGRAAGKEGSTPPVISRSHARVDTGVIDWPSLHLVGAIKADPNSTLALARRVRRRLNGWARPDQWQYANDILPLLRDLRPSAVVVNNDPEIAVFLRRKMPHLRVIHWFHNLELCSDQFRHRFAADKGIVSVAVSRYLARAVEQVYGMTPLSVHVSLNGVDASRFDVKDRPDRLPTIGYLGRIAVEKGADTLLRAAILLRQRGIDFAVQLVGDTNWAATNENPYSRMVWQLAGTLSNFGVEVRRLGHVAWANIPSALAQSDIHVVPSRWDEPFGLTLVEGLASGQAVVASATGGMPEVLGPDGQLFPREDDTALAAALEPLVADAGLRQRWGSAARHRAEELPWSASWERMRDLAAIAP